MSGVDRFNQRADLALAKQGVLTDKELLSIDDLRDAWNAQSDAFNSWDELGTDEIIWFAQQQAIARYAALTQPAPEAERLPGPSDELLEFWRQKAIAEYRDSCYEVSVSRSMALQAIAWFAQQQALARWGRPAIQPVPVAERLPEPEDCDADGFCWFWDLEWSRWQPGQEDQGCTYWLPHYALPIPLPTQPPITP